MEKLRNVEQILGQKTIDMFREGIEVKKKIEQWYHPMKRIPEVKREDILID